MKPAVDVHIKVTPSHAYIFNISYKVGVYILRHNFRTHGDFKKCWNLACMLVSNMHFISR